MFKCTFCGHSFNVLQKYDLHQYFHRNNRKSRFICLHDECNMQFNSYNTFRSHLLRFHKNEPSISLFDNSKWLECSKENCVFKTQTYKSFKSHVYTHLKNQEFMQCPFINRCKISSVFKKVPNLRTHFFRKHHSIFEDFSKSNFVQNEVQNNIDTFSITNIFQDVANNDGDQSDELLGLKGSEKIGLSLFSHLLMSLEANYFVSKAAIQKIVIDISDINNINTNCLLKLISDNGTKNINDNLLSSNVFSLAKQKLSSEWRRQQYYQNNLAYIKPIKVPLTNKSQTSFFYYIPILDTLKLLLNNKNIQGQIFIEYARKDNVFSDISDGSCVKNNQFFLNNNKAIKIILYQDSFECCNPLGSARKKYKINGIYMTIANINPWHRSKVDQIQLVALCFEKDIKTYGFFEIFKPIVADINILETVGIDFNNTCIKGTLLAVLGDNLGSHQIGGFTESFSKETYVCRFCYKLGCAYQYNETFKPRTVNSYTSDVDFALVTDQKNYLGVKSESVLNLVHNFHVCNPGLPPCLAHDLFEGIVQYDLPLMLDKLVHAKLVSYEQINKELKELKFSVGFKKQDLPTLKKCKKLIGTASQNLYLIYVIPFALFNLLKNKNENNLNENDYWQMILVLRKICNLLLCFSISTDQIAILKSLINDYLELRTTLFDNISLKPKHHYLLHYPHLTRVFGPLRHLWTLRFESKHSYFKNVIRHCPNFKNILLSLSNKHQLLQCLESSKGNQFEEKAVVNNANIFMIQNFPKELQSTIEKSNIFGNNSCKYISQAVTFRGVFYSECMYICYEKESHNSYKICLIQHVIINNHFDNLCFIGLGLVICYDHSSGLYLIEKKEEGIVIVYFDQLLTPEPLIHSNIENNEVFYFMSPPLEFI